MRFSNSLQSGLLLAALSVGLITPQDLRAETWLLVEARTLPGGCNHPVHCIDRSALMFRNMLSLTPQNKERFRQLINSMATIRGVPDTAVAPLAVAMAAPGFHAAPVAEKLQPLVNHPGVYFDSTKLDKKEDVAGFSNFVRAELKRLRLRELTEEEWQKTPGRPVLSVSYSPRRDTAGCIIPYSVSFSIKEEVVLTRDPSVKITAVVWSAFSKENLAIAHFTHLDALRDLMEKFSKDYGIANTKKEASH
ncbi:MAG: hypothetical protein AAF393_14105 [Pseudomonadota bacterium]